MHTPPRILIVDDDRDLLSLLTMRCRTLGFEVLTAEDGIEGVMLALRESPDLFIFDAGLPASNGIALAEMITRDPRFVKTPQIILTGRSDDQTLKHCARIGADYLCKGQDTWESLSALITKILPAQTPRDTEINPEPKAASPDKSRPRVLVIDDDAQLRRAYEIRLTAAGWSVLNAPDGKLGFAAALQTHPDAIVMDYSMPDAWGDYVLGRLKEHPLTANIPVMIVTGASLSGETTSVHDYALERRMYGIGAAAFFTKPIDFAALTAELNNCLAAQASA